MSEHRFVFAIALLIAAWTARRGEAGLVPWSYQWSARPVVVDADPLGPHNAPVGGIHLTPGAITIVGGQPGVALGNANIVAVNLAAFTFAPSPNGKPYHFSNAPYRLGVTLTDVDSGKSGALSFAGVFDGSFTDWKMDLGTRFTSAVRKSLILGHHCYTVSLSAFTPPDPPSQGGQGNISAFVSVQPDSAPEPSSLMLAVAGILAAALGLVRIKFPV
jgi:hypothetical protein